ncbi:response regulator [Deinococcus malanensis]|uniref:response regulator n=1 Tax=Deinococcus malanensis TaxID=1706855 RepID=UPI003642E1D1
MLLDLGLPDLDGGDVISRLRKTSLVPIIAVTARDEVEEKVRVLTLGADDYVVKPFDMAELLAHQSAVAPARHSGSEVRAFGSAARTPTGAVSGARATVYTQGV